MLLVSDTDQIAAAARRVNGAAPTVTELYAGVKVPVLASAEGEMRSEDGAAPGRGTPIERRPPDGRWPTGRRREVQVTIFRVHALFPRSRIHAEIYALVRSPRSTRRHPWAAGPLRSADRDELKQVQSVEMPRILELASLYSSPGL